MPLDQPVVIFPSDVEQSGDAKSRALPPSPTDAPLEVGKLAHAILHLRRVHDEPVTPDELVETHTRKFIS